MVLCLFFYKEAKKKIKKLNKKEKIIYRELRRSHTSFREEI
jgi:hypothetical protein